MWRRRLLTLLLISPLALLAGCGRRGEPYLPEERESEGGGGGGY